MIRRQRLTKLASTANKPQLQHLRGFDRSWSCERLSNGLRVVHVPRPHDQRVYLGATVRVGSRYEQANTLGISHFLEHMMFRGSKKYPTFRKLAEAFEWMGGEWNAGTGQEHTEYWFSGSHQSMVPATNLFLEFLNNPKLNDIDVERKIIFREIDGELNEFGLSTDLDYHTHRLMWPNSSLANPVMGTKETLARIGLADLKKYRAKHYQPNNMAIVIVGGTPAESIAAKVAAAFSKSTSKPKRLEPKHARLSSCRGPKVALVRHPDNEYFVQLSFRTKGEWHPEAASYDLIRRILADGFCSRLGNRIREQLGMVYDIDAEVSLFSDTGSLDIYAHISLDKIKPFLMETTKILRALRDHGPKVRELERAKRRSLIDIELLPSDPDHLGFKIGWSVLNDKRPSLERGFDMIMAKTPQNIQQIAAQIFKASRCSFVMLGPEQQGLTEAMRECLSKWLE